MCIEDSIIQTKINLFPTNKHLRMMSLFEYYYSSITISILVLNVYIIKYIFILIYFSGHLFLLLLHCNYCLLIP